MVLAAFSVRTITALRSVAIASNLMFIAYAATAHLMPVLILRALLLPLNVWRLRQDLASNEVTKTSPFYLEEQVTAIELNARNCPMRRYPLGQPR